MEYIKVDDNVIKVVDSVTEVKEKVYTYELLLEIKANLEAERERVIGNINEKLVEVNALLAECDKLEITEKPVIEVVEAVEPIEAVKEVVPIK